MEPCPPGRPAPGGEAGTGEAPLKRWRRADAEELDEEGRKDQEAKRQRRPRRGEQARAWGEVAALMRLWGEEGGGGGAGRPG